MMAAKKNSNRQVRKLARRKLMKGLTADPRAGYKRKNK
jgi:hypothetical protein